jgi:carbon monoxide dehydrogenase subunit G
MKLRNEFSIGAPVDETWDMLLDIQRVAQCLPGATIEPADGDGVYRGQMKVRLGPMTVHYQGTAKLGEVDEDDHVATIDVKGKEARGQGTASATITNSVSPEGDRTKVVVETDLNVTGRPAQFGRGIMEDVAAKMLADFAKRLENELQTGGPAAPAEDAPQTVGATRGAAAPGTGAGSAGAPGTSQGAPAGAQGAGSASSSSAGASSDDDALDLGSAIYGPLAKRVGIGAAVLLLVVALLAATRRRRRGFEVVLRYR